MKVAALALAACTAVVVAQEPTNGQLCEPDYDCFYTYVDRFGTLYDFDFTSLCDANFPGYQFMDTTTNYTYAFNICGYSPKKCIPKGHHTHYTYGTAVQFLGNRPACQLNDSSTMCVDPTTNNTVCCTEDCEVLGVGTPIWSLIDPTNPATGGIKLTYTAISASSDDRNQCPIDPKTGAPLNRDMTFVISCNPSLAQNSFSVSRVYENTTCRYVMEMQAAAACGCAPQCDSGKLCGSDSCTGYCSGAALQGSCPYGQICQADQTCCRPDCSNRDCGDDGCGNSCGTCGPDETCSTAHVCVSAIPYLPVSAATYAVDHGNLAGAFFGGISTIIVLGAVAWFFLGGGKTRFDTWRYAGPDGAAVKTSLVSGAATRSYGGGGSSFAPTPVATQL